MKFIGHLDTMRYFQKAVRRAGLPAAYSEGFSPHMIMSFAAPLGVGMTSKGEYFDLELSENMATSEILRRLEATMTEDIHVVHVGRIEEAKSANAMALVAAADYEIHFRPGSEPGEGWQEKFLEFCSQKEICVRKKTKRSEREVDLKPCIYEVKILPENGIFLKLASASSNYTKPELVLDTFFAWMGEKPGPFAYQICRLEVYAAAGEGETASFCPLYTLGEVWK